MILIGSGACDNEKYMVGVVFTFIASLVHHPYKYIHTQSILQFVILVAAVYTTIVTFIVQLALCLQICNMVAVYTQQIHLIVT